MTDRVLGISPYQIPWEITHPDGSKSATLVGTRDSGVQFTYAFFIPAGVWDPPHSHPADAHLHVAFGSLSLGYGDVFAPVAAETYGVGSFLFVPAGSVHFDGSSEDTILIGTAIGPWSTDYVAHPDQAVGSWALSVRTSVLAPQTTTATLSPDSGR